MKVFKSKRFEKNNKEVVIILCVNERPSEDPCGAYDESPIPTSIAHNLVTEWEILPIGELQCTCVRGQTPLRNSDRVKLCRFAWLKSQANHLTVFISPKTFALTTCTSRSADENIRKSVMNDTALPPAKTDDPFQFLTVKGEGTIIISDIPIKCINQTRTSRMICQFDVQLGLDKHPTSYPKGLQSESCIPGATMQGSSKPD